MTDGVDVIDNDEEVIGDLELGLSDDTYIERESGSVTGIVDGGDGVDTLVFYGGLNPFKQIDGTQYINFEILEIRGNYGTSLTSIAGISEISVFDGTLVLRESALPGAAVNLQSDGDITLINSEIGDVTGDASDDTITLITDSAVGAISLAGGNDRVDLRDGFVLNGALDGGLGDDNLVFFISGDETFDLDVSPVSNFETVRIANEGSLTFSGTGALPSVTVDGGELVFGSPNVSVQSLFISDQFNNPIVTVAEGATLTTDITAEYSSILVDGELGGTVFVASTLELSLGPNAVLSSQFSGNANANLRLQVESDVVRNLDGDDFGIDVSSIQSFGDGEVTLDGTWNNITELLVNSGTTLLSETNEFAFVVPSGDPGSIFFRIFVEADALLISDMPVLEVNLLEIDGTFDTGPVSLGEASNDVVIGAAATVNGTIDAAGGANDRLTLELTPNDSVEDLDLQHFLNFEEATLRTNGDLTVLTSLEFDIARLQAFGGTLTIDIADLDARNL